MMQCSRCHVDVHAQHSKCPLCQKPLIPSGISTTHYPIYEMEQPEAQIITRFRLLLFLSLTAIILSVTINALTFYINPVLWSPILTVGILYLWVVIKDTFLSAKHIGRKILWNYLTLSAFLLVIDVCSGFTGWSTNYVIPLFGIVATFFMTFFAILYKSLWQNDIGYILAMFFINLIPILLFTFRLSYIVWPCVAAIVYSLLTILAMLIFYQKQFKSEMQKRFHL